MKKLIEKIQNIWKVEELRKRILLTLFLTLIYRLGSFVIIPGVNYNQLTAYNESSGSNVLTDLLSLFSGGSFSNASIMALGIMPYISASIIMQLLGVSVPSVQKMQKDGESGRKKINNYTRILTIAICAVQAPAYLSMWVASRNALPTGDALNSLWWIQSVVVLVAGAMFAVWLGERITDKGVGNGISILITVGIMSQLPGSLLAEIGVNSDNLIKVVLELAAFVLIIMVTILIVQGVRKIPINVAKRIVSSRSENVAQQGSRSYLPIKVNAAGVMPIIFAQAIVTIPMMLVSNSATESPSWFQTAFTDIYGVWYNILLGLLIIIFTYFYTAITINPTDMSDDLKKNGGFIPGVKPGSETTEYIDSLISRITLPGSIFLAIIAVIPAIVHSAVGITSGFEQFFGGTSLLIMVAVVIDTLQQIESYLLNRHMDGLVDNTRSRKRFSRKSSLNS